MMDSPDAERKGTTRRPFDINKNKYSMNHSSEHELYVSAGVKMWGA